MSNVLTVEKQKLQIECFCCKCGYRMIEGDEAMVSFSTLEAGVHHHTIMIAWCLGCFSNYECPPIDPKRIMSVMLFQRLRERKVD